MQIKWPKNFCECFIIKWSMKIEKFVRYANRFYGSFQRINASNK